MLWVNAGAPQKEELTNTGTMGSVNNVVLDLEILEKELHRRISICLDPPDACGRQDNNGRFLFGEKPINASRISQLELRTRARHQVMEPGVLQFAQ